MIGDQRHPLGQVCDESLSIPEFWYGVLRDGTVSLHIYTMLISYVNHVNQVYFPAGEVRIAERIMRSINRSV